MGTIGLFRKCLLEKSDGTIPDDGGGVPLRMGHTIIIVIITSFVEDSIIIPVHIEVGVVVTHCKPIRPALGHVVVSAVVCTVFVEILTKQSRSITAAAQALVMCTDVCEYIHG